MDSPCTELIGKENEKTIEKGSTDLQEKTETVVSSVNEKAQFYIIDMQCHILDHDERSPYKYFLVYQEEYSKYTVLKSLRENSTHEVVENLIDIFSTISPPRLITTDNSTGFCTKVTETIAEYVPSLTIKIQHEESEKPTKRNFKKLLFRWKRENPTVPWHIGLKLLQISINTRFNPNSNKMPFELLFSHLIAENFQNFLKLKSSGAYSVENGTADVWKGSDEDLKLKQRKRTNSSRQSTKTVDNNSQLECSYCKQKFNFPSVLKRHVRSHTNERPYVCEICSKSFKQLGHLSQHTLTHTNLRTPQCTLCGIKFETLEQLKEHLSTSHSRGREKFVKSVFECDNCKKVFTTKSVLERHILTHTHERQFDCSVCGKRFKQAGHVKSHMLVHTGERKFVCTICSKRFSLSNSLKKHMYVHNGEKPFQCDVCGSRFLERRNLNGHLMTHTNERPFGCKICGKRYTLADTLRRHVSAAHEDGRTYQCEICAKMFKQLAHLSVHKKVHTNERPFQCHLCDKNFKHKNVLKSHLAIHANLRPFECDICKSTFVRKTNLQTHIASAHMNERPYPCKICNKRFKQVSHLNGHIIVHSNSMPYQCDFCDRRCNRLDNLKKHMKLHERNK